MKNSINSGSTCLRVVDTRRSEHRAFRWVYISGRNPNVAVASYSRKRPCIAARFAQAGQEGVSQGIKTLAVLAQENNQKPFRKFVL